MRGADDETRWFIDALDADGGVAFASCRQAHGVDGDEGDGHAVLMRAPYFTPEAVSSPAVALGAIHIGAQSGVFIDGSELGFDSLQQVAEFVRRCYVAGGTSRGDPAPPAPDAPEPGPGGEGWEPPIDWPRYKNNNSLQEAAGVVSQWLTADNATQAEEDMRTRGGYPPMYAALIERAIKSLIETIVSRMPAHRDNDEFSQEWQAWLELVDHMRLLTCEIWETDDEADYKLARAVYRLATRTKGVDGGDTVLAWLAENTVAAISRATVRAFASDSWETPLTYLFGWRYSRRHSRGRYPRGREIFRALASIPIPVELTLPGDRSGNESVADFLARSCATGCVGLDSPLGVSIVVFAAHWIVAASETGWDSSNRYYRRASHDASLSRATNWLRAQYAGELPFNAAQWVVGTRIRERQEASGSVSATSDE